MVTNIYHVFYYVMCVSNKNILLLIVKNKKVFEYKFFLINDIILILFL